MYSEFGYINTIQCPEMRNILHSYIDVVKKASFAWPVSKFVQNFIMRDKSLIAS